MFCLDNCSSPAIAIAVTDPKVPETANVENFTNGNGNGKESPQGDDNVLPERCDFLYLLF